MTRTWVVAELKKCEVLLADIEAGTPVPPGWEAEVRTRIEIYRRLLVEGFHDDSHACRPLPMVAAYTPHSTPRTFTPPHGIRREGY